MTEFYPWQDELWQRWLELRTRLPHALLLRGPQGVGKFNFALNLAQSLLCKTPTATGMACDDCPSCLWFKQETHPDFRLLQPEALSAPEEEKEGGKKPAKQITVEQIRELADFANLSAHQGGHRVMLIHPAEAMNPNAANALLKTLEEPSGNMLIMLVCHRPQRLLPTILSRCLALHFSIPKVEVSTAWLQRQGIDKPQLALAQAGFAPLQAARLATENNEAVDNSHFLQAISQPAKLDIYALSEQLLRLEPIQVIHWMQQWCYDLASLKLMGKVRYNVNLVDIITHISSEIDISKLMQYHKELMTAKREAYHPLNPKLLFESLLLSYKQAMHSGKQAMHPG